jgi:glycosyltransferase involved in cell wall biosynthesis
MVSVKVVFAVSGLMTGGAEMMLYKLLQHLAPERLQPLVISLGRLGRPAALMARSGVEVIGLGLDVSPLALPRELRRAHDIVRKFQPDLISGWMYHGNLLAWALGRRAGTPLIWNIRQTLNLKGEKWQTRRVIRAGALLSKAPRRILYVSRLASEQHAAVGYSQRLCAVVPNGFDLDVFQRDDAHRRRIRAELAVSDSTRVIGHLGRYHPMKDQLGLIAAARRVLAQEDDVLFVLAGAGISDNPRLAAAVRGNGMQAKIRLLGETDCPQALLSACDLFCLPSAWGEGFPNVVGEAMACELPCVVTQVGEGPAIVGETGLAVDPGDPEALAQALLQLVRLECAERTQLGRLARDRIAQNFSLSRVATLYENHFREALNV